ncbi:RDD family protein [Herbivorax sp. ANBcel31]|uniref:RDD family protein n=1 Tax=Herbivorax sp. ANBcel31 TaxID=3069754 RepID=UPI0027B2D6E9|nr:RDD family protein [Herbivorax sp. ANBcel31]MDQ2086601.1 RDD family protein [Herbivorax sp. ANBcel31]
MKIYSGFWIRFIASIIDSVILVIPNLFLIILDFHIACFILNWLYFSLYESSSHQGTIGKRILKIKVVDINGKKISFLKATARYLCKFISAAIFLAGYIMAAFTRKKQSFHDMITDTVVIKKNSTIEEKPNNAINGMKEEKPLILKFMSVFFIIVGIFPLLSMSTTYFLMLYDIPQQYNELYQAFFRTIPIALLLLCASIITGIGLMKQKKWAWWLASFLLSYFLISSTKVILDLPTGINENFTLFPYLALLLILLCNMFNPKVMRKFKLPDFSEKILFLMPLFFILLSFLAHKGIEFFSNILLS